MRKFIPYGKQNIDEDDIEAVVKVLQSSLITQGPEVEEFEGRVAEYCGAKYAVAVNSGTSALHAAMYAAGIKPGYELISSPVTFLATANAAVYLGARPVFMDMDPATYCLDIAKIEGAINSNTQAIVPVDYAGYPVDMEKIVEIARRHDLVVIEDAAHALGAKRRGRIVGSQADMSILSFHPVKHITTGEGGMVLTDNKEYYNKLRLFRNHGILREEEGLEKKHGPWYYEMQDLGYNFRLTAIQAALGISQLKKLEGFLDERQRIARRYDEAFRDCDLVSVPPRPGDGSRHAYHLYPLLLAKEFDRRAFFEYMRGNNIGVQVHYIPVHLQPFYREKFGCQAGDFPVAEDFYQREVSLPIFPGLSEEEQDYVIKKVLDYK